MFVRNYDGVSLHWKINWKFRSKLSNYWWISTVKIAGRVSCGGARETHWVISNDSFVTMECLLAKPSSFSNLPAFLDLNGSWSSNTRDLKVLSKTLYSIFPTYTFNKLKYREYTVIFQYLFHPFCIKSSFNLSSFFDSVTGSCFRRLKCIIHSIWRFNKKMINSLKHLIIIIMSWQIFVLFRVLNDDY